MDLRKTLRGAMWVLASAVALIAATVSYTHIYALARSHGGNVTDARLLPLSVDALILVGELMLLHEADKKGQRYFFGWALVWSGILATLTANVAFGAQFGIAGALLWGWPAYSFILAAAGMVSIVKRQGAEPVVDPVLGIIATNAHEAAMASLRATLEAGNPLSQRQIADRFGLSRADARTIYTSVIPAANGHVLDEEAV